MLQNMVTLQKYVFATFTFAAIFFICWLCMACAKKDNILIVTTDTTSLSSPKDTTTIVSSKTMLALGDSYTIGQNVGVADRFPNQTISLLKTDHITVKYPSTFVATTGWTTRNLIDGIKSANLSGTYDVVTLLIGVNNQFQHIDTNVYKTEFPQLLNTAIAFAKGLKTHVFVVSIPDYGVTPFGGGNANISAEIDHYNAMCKTMTEQLGVTFVNITPISKIAATDQTFTANDGLHPSAKQYLLWAQLLWPKMDSVLR